MIYTCTCNPSLDYYLSLNELKKGDLNRSDFELYAVGGKGVNVSIILNNLGIRSVALGFLGGFIKNFYLSSLDQYKLIQPGFTNIEGNSRIDVRLMENIETTINASGPLITKEEFQKFRNKLRNLYDDDIFVLSGNVEDSIEDDMIALVRDLAREGLRIFLDTNRRIIDECASDGIYFVRLAKEDVEEDEKAADLMKTLYEKGVKNVLYGQRKEPILFLTEGKMFESSFLIDEHISDVSSISSLIGGYLYSLLKGGDIMECFRYGIASCLVTALSDIRTTQDQIKAVFDRVSYREIV